MHKTTVWAARPGVDCAFVAWDDDEVVDDAPPPGEAAEAAADQAGGGGGGVLAEAQAPRAALLAVVSLRLLTLSLLWPYETTPGHWIQSSARPIPPCRRRLYTLANH
ncbi:hypothetical protein FOZ60_016022 [Perkinsus olseni]|uniref:Uncharacterized protein n=1 Tax=Perkinsus olseni TaxID=32597 RepID=A0A7J6P5U4_PEROL|nr:hypothetical protein FOZ60_016022 [Perkinsus olseni]